MKRSGMRDEKFKLNTPGRGKNFTYFLVIGFALLLAVFLTGIPNKTVALR